MPFRWSASLALSFGLLACRGGESFTAVPTTIDIVPGAMSFGTLGRVRGLTAVTRDQRGDTVRGASVQWSIGNGSVASVDGSGNVTALGLGATHAYASAQGSAGPIRDSAAVTVTQVPAQLVKVSGDRQLDTAFGTLPVAITVQVNDSLGHPIAGVPVGFAVTLGGGGISAPADTTDPFGRAAIVWTLGSTVGANALSATVTGSGISGNPASFGATAVTAGSRPSVAAAAGDGQTGLVGFAVNTPPTVLVRGAGGAPLAGTPVQFTVTGGGGNVQGSSTLTDANGRAQVGAWSLTLGVNTLTATVQDTGYIGNPVTFAATGAAAAYHIDVRFPVATTPARQAVFDAAASKWESLIFGDVPDVPLNVSANRCVSGQPAIHETVDDIVIYAILDSIDGPGKILGQAGPCFVRSGSQLPVIGVMEFDTADVAGLEATGRFALVIEHEMGHVLGYGTIWGSLLVDPVSGGNPGADPHFVGTQALAAFDQSGGVNYGLSAKVPIENTGGTGTVNAHWRESVFKNELMTGFINSGANPLSVVTTASMGDLGYQVNYAGSDVYVVSPAPPVATQGMTLVLGDDIRRMPIGVVDVTGRVLRTIPPR